MKVLVLAAMQVAALPQLASVQVDSKRIAAETAADADVIRSLKENGDIPSIARPVDVRFVGSKRELKRLQSALEGAGWSAIQTVKIGDGSYALDIQQIQTTEPPALLELATTALKIEVAFGVRYDGWGSVAQTEVKKR